MLKHYLKIAIRHLRQQKVITAINIAGLSIGMACCILIILFVKDERSYDTFHVNANSIYRLNSAIIKDNEANRIPMTQFAAAPALKAELVDVKRAVRIQQEGQTLLSYKDKQITEDVVYADEDYFKMFSFPLKEGNPAKVLKAPYTMVITEKIAKKYFGSEEPVGKVMRVGTKFDCQITGVAQDMLLNSDVKHDVIISFATYKQMAAADGNNLEEDSWFFFSNTTTYVQLNEHASIARANRELVKLRTRHIDKIAKSLGLGFEYELQPLLHTHLRQRGDKDVSAASRLIYFYMIIAAFILLIACFNFMNLVTARANERALEVGLRKVMGGARKTLIAQFLSESILLSILSFIIAVLLSFLILPFFNAFADKSLHLFGWQQLPMLGGLLLVSLLVGVIAGSYPAFYLSGFLPIAVLKGNFKSSGSRVWMRKGLVIAQFFVTVVLIIATIVTESQLRYWQHKDLGFDKERLLNVYLKYNESRKVATVLKAEILRSHYVKSATLSNIAMGLTNSMNPVVKDGDTDDKSVTTSIITGDFDLLKTMDIKLSKGRDFSPALSTDSNNTFIVNQAFVRAMGLKDPIGTVIKWEPGGTVRKGEIIGVVKDFNYQTLLEPVSPAICFIAPQNVLVLNIRLNAGDVPKQMAELEKIWKGIVPAYPFETSFVADDLAKQYVEAGRVAKLFGVFSLLSIFIACMGLFGLSILISRQRMKEIGIRKVLGASVLGITTLLSKDFMKLIGVAIILATPLAWFVMNKWLENFANRINVEWWMLLMAGIISIFIALLTISFQSVKAALMNPVRSLKTE
ncbi:putative ABC transport system permease protein [Chitinophaga sp. CF118]|uniref:ABC transporter permease n=1 Tax=Chitinophaga sp. CF118 TaxID=1884367 RepID=UPI0008E8342F|nr:ABC transporter permease [Chitinophaga sp. CF118]SFE73424.1 putative ABC transport system permease protein [Chitinophaga sp. CF118]